MLICELQIDLIVLSFGLSFSVYYCGLHLLCIQHPISPCTSIISLALFNRIDGELHRLRHKHEHDQEWLDKQRQWAKMEPTLPAGFEFNDAETTFDTEGKSVPGFTAGVDRGISPVQRRKDEKMANDDPMRYCADRCVSTGNCDVFEDMFDMDPREVIKFCKECVLSEDEEPCDVPDAFLDDDSGLHP